MVKFEKANVDKEVLADVISMKDATVCVNFISEYASVTPSDNCIHINGSSLQRSLDCFSLLKYKSICIHRKVFI